MPWLLQKEKNLWEEAFELLHNSLEKDPWEDDLVCPETDKAHIRFIHAAATVGTVDFHADGNVLFGKVRYGETGNPTYLSVPSSEYDIDIVIDGRIIGADMFLQPQQIYTVILTGTLENDDAPLDAIITEDNHGMCIVL